MPQRLKTMMPPIGSGGGGGGNSADRGGLLSAIIEGAIQLKKTLTPEILRTRRDEIFGWQERYEKTLQLFCDSGHDNLAEDIRMQIARSLYASIERFSKMQPATSLQGVQNLPALESFVFTLQSCCLFVFLKKEYENPPPSRYMSIHVNPIIISWLGARGRWLIGGAEGAEVGDDSRNLSKL